MPLKPDLNAGISTGVKYWLFFMLALFLLRYDPPLTIVLGAIGGLAAGFVDACLKAKPEEGPAKEDKPADQSELTGDSSGSRRKFDRYGVGAMRTRHQPPKARRFDFFFRRRK